MKYKISHRTLYKYETTASLSHNELFLVPRNTSYQTCESNLVHLTPEASTRSVRQDYFGNIAINTTLETAHTELEILATSQVSLLPNTAPVASLTPPWEQVKENMARFDSQEILAAYEFVFPSPMIQTEPLYAKWALDVFRPNVPILEGALGLINRIFNEFKYDPRATTSATPLAEAFEIKRGVCQDFAHIGIACLRSLGLAARYVSGYLHTQPPPGKPKLVGVDASHAWLAIYIPGTGWIDLDPTNNIIPKDQHLTLAWGRDYGDVTPVRGTVLGGGNHRLEVSVDVVQSQG